MSASLSRREGPTSRIAGWGVARSTRRGGNPHVAAPAALESAFALASLSRAPHLFGRPHLRPLHRHVFAVERVGRSPQHLPQTSWRPRPYFVFSLRAESSCAGVMSAPTTR